MKSKLTHAQQLKAPLTLITMILIGEKVSHIPNHKYNHSEVYTMPNKPKCSISIARSKMLKTSTKFSSLQINQFIRIIRFKSKMMKAIHKQMKSNKRVTNYKKDLMARKKDTVKIMKN